MSKPAAAAIATARRLGADPIRAPAPRLRCGGEQVIDGLLVRHSQLHRSPRSLASTRSFWRSCAVEAQRVRDPLFPARYELLEHRLAHEIRRQESLAQDEVME